MSEIKFCWHCSRRFYGNRSVKLHINGAERKLHKCCSDDIKVDNKDPRLKIFGYDLTPKEGE